MDESKIKTPELEQILEKTKRIATQNTYKAFLLLKSISPTMIREYNSENIQDIVDELNKTKQEINKIRIDVAEKSSEKKYDLSKTTDNITASTQFLEIYSILTYVKRIISQELNLSIKEENLKQIRNEEKKYYKLFSNKLRAFKNTSKTQEEKELFRTFFDFYQHELQKISQEQNPYEIHIKKIKQPIQYNVTPKYLFQNGLN